MIKQTWLFLGVGLRGRVLLGLEVCVRLGEGLNCYSVALLGFLFLIFFNPHLRTRLLTLEREERRWGDTERKTSISCLCMCPYQGANPQPRNVPWPCALTGDQTCSHLVYGTILQPTEQPNQDCTLWIYVFMMYVSMKRMIKIFITKKCSFYMLNLDSQIQY